MPSERPRTELLPLNVALAIMLAIAGGIQTWNNFNTGLTEKVATLTERINGLQRQIDELRDMERRRPDGRTR